MGISVHDSRISKSIPETLEEELEGRDTTYGVDMKLLEDLPPSKFDSNALQSAPLLGTRLPLMAQFNEAKRLSQPIFRFAGFFKIIESHTHVGASPGD